MPHATPDTDARPSPTPRDLGDYATRYAALPFEPIQVEYRRRAVMEVVRALGARRVIEVGCGLESLAPYVSDYDSWTIVEPAAAFAREARKLVTADGRVTVLECTMEEGAERGAFGPCAPDLVLLSSLLHEVPSPSALLEGVRSVCDAQTVVHVNVPNASSFHRELAVAMGIIPAVDAVSEQQSALQQSRIFDADSLARAMRDAGFAVSESGGYLLKPFTHTQMQAMVDGGTIDRTILDGLYQLGRKFPALASEIFVNARLS